MIISLQYTLFSHIFWERNRFGFQFWLFRLHVNVDGNVGKEFGLSRRDVMSGQKGILGTRDKGLRVKNIKAKVEPKRSQDVGHVV